MEVANWDKSPANLQFMESHDMTGRLGPSIRSAPCGGDEDLNTAQGLIRMVGVGKIVRCDKMPPLPSDVIV